MTRRLINSNTDAVLLTLATPEMVAASDETAEGHITVVETPRGWRVVSVGGESLAATEHHGAPLVRAYVER